MTTLSDTQFQTLIATMMSTVRQEDSNPVRTTPKHDPAALGPIRPCLLGTNKMVKLTRFEEWQEEAENRMT